MKPCFRDDELYAFLSDRLSAPRNFEVADHLETCPDCRSRLNDLCDDPGLRGWCDRVRSAAAGTATSAASGVGVEARVEEWLRAVPRPIDTAADDSSAGVSHASSPSTALVAEGAVFTPRMFGQYELLSELGRGGMGIVYRARHTRLGRSVAIKLLQEDRLRDAAAVSRFDREMQSIGRLHHPHIVQAYDAGEIEGKHYLAMEFVDGCDLEALAGPRGRLSVADACEAARQAATGLAHAHEHGLVHRDVKPSNLLVSREGVVKVADLGLARFMNVDSTAAVTASGNLVGTADYIAPEQAAGSRELDGRADLYNLGCVLFRLLVGRPPFHGGRYDSSMKKLFGHVNDDPPRIERIRDDVPRDIAELVHCLLAKDPHERPRSAEEVADALAPFARDADLAARVGDARDRTDIILGDGGLAVSLQHTGTFGGTTANAEATFPQSTGGRRRVRPAAVTALAAALVLGAVSVALWQGAGGVAPEQPTAAPTEQEGLPEGTALASLPAGTRLFGSGEPDKIPPHLVAAPRGFAELAPDQIQRGKWYDLLKHQPRMLLWPPTELSSFHVDTDKEALQANVAGKGLLSLGTIDHDNYTFQIDLHQNGWKGGLGVFFGFHEEGSGDDRKWSFQYIKLDPATISHKRFQVVRVQEWLWRDADGEIHNPGTVRAGALIPAPFDNFESRQLEIIVRQGRLARVRWNGDDLPELVGPDVNRHFEPEDYRGQFGTYHGHRDGMFLKARVRVDSGERFDD
ncbi:MAG: protein kinase [Planctomycetaceae bacterium]